MELTKKDVFDMVGFIKANYSYAYKDVNDDLLKIMMRTWFNSLSKYSKEVVEVAFMKAIEVCKMPPTLADIIQNIKRIENANEPTDTELWQELVDCVDKANDCIYYFQFQMVEDNGKTQSENAKERFNKLWEEMPQILKDYCGNKTGLYELTQVDLEFEKSRFLKQIQTLRQRQEIKQEINFDLLELEKEKQLKIGV